MSRSVFWCPVRAFAVPALGLSLFACATAAPASLDNAVPAHAPDTVAAVEQGYALPSCTHGLGQSPIDILTRAVVPVAHAVAPHYGSSQGHIRNLGHTIQLDYDGGSYLEFEGERYDLAQFHFHTPSEHRIDGMTFPMELHVVHRRHDDGSGAPHYLVIGVLYKCGDDDPFLARFLDLVPSGKHDRTDLADLRIATRMCSATSSATSITTVVR